VISVVTIAAESVKNTSLELEITDALDGLNSEASAFLGDEGTF